MIKKFIYIAGPYSHPTDSMPNVKKAIEVADLLIESGKTCGIEIIPFIPHLCHFWEQHGKPKDYETWMQFDENWLSKCDMIFVINRSKGVDREMAFAQHNNIEIIEDYVPGSLFKWLQKTEKETVAKVHDTMPDAVEELNKLNAEHKKMSPFINLMINMIAKLFIILFFVALVMIPVIGMLGLIQIAKFLFTGIF